MDALGMIETKGLIPAIECIDIMLKTAQVVLVSKTLVGDGLVTICVTGDVGAVQSSVEAGSDAVERFGCEKLISQYVIPRPHEDIKMIVLSESMAKFSHHNIIENILNTNTPCRRNSEIIKTAAKKEKICEVPCFDKSKLMSFQRSDIDEFIKQYCVEKLPSILKQMTVSALRHLSREYPAIGLSGKERSRASKATLIHLITSCYK